MARQLEFIKDEVLVQDIHGFTGAIAVVKGRWKVKCTDYPNGFSYHRFYKVFDDDTLTLETFVALDDVTDEMLETWVVGDVSEDTKQKIYQAALPVIRQTHFEAGLTRHYRNPSLG